MRTQLPLLIYLALCCGSAAAGDRHSDALQDLRGFSPDAGPGVESIQIRLAALADLSKKSAVETDRFLETHQQAAAKYQAMTSVHLPVARNWCSICHASVEDPSAMREDGNSLCLACHKPQNEALKKSHMGVTIFSDKCTVCHNPHGSSETKLLRSEGQHPAFPSCTMCHSGVSTQGEPALQDDLASACKACHPQIDEAMNAKVVHGAVLMGACTNCHNPHFSPRRRFLRAAPQDFCRGCHDIPDIGHPFGNHRPFKVGPPGRGPLPDSYDCTSCHLPHSGELPKLLRAPKQYLCRTCHKM